MIRHQPSLALSIVVRQRRLQYKQNSKCVLFLLHLGVAQSFQIIESANERCVRQTVGPGGFSLSHIRKFNGERLW